MDVLTRPALLERPGARVLHVYDGRHLIGHIVDVDGRGPAHGFDPDDQPLGTFATRKIALAAISTRHAHDAEAGR